MKHVFKAIYQDRAGVCQNCGRPVPFIAHAFAHIKSKRLLNKTQKKDPKYILLVCPALHIFQSQGGNNMLNDFCVSLYIAKYGHLIIKKNTRGKEEFNFKDFYRGLLNEIECK